MNTYICICRLLLIHINNIFCSVYTFAGDHEDGSVKPRCQIIKDLIINRCKLLNLWTLFIWVNICIHVTSKASFKVIICFNISHCRFNIFFIKTEALLFAKLLDRSSIPDDIELTSIWKWLNNYLECFFNFSNIALIAVGVHDLTSVNHEDKVLGFKRAIENCCLFN